MRAAARSQHRVACILDQVHQDLLQLHAIASHLRQAGANSVNTVTLFADRSLCISLITSWIRSCTSSACGAKTPFLRTNAVAESRRSRVRRRR